MNKKIFFPLIIVILASIFASQHPDGLDKVSKIFNFSGKAIEHKSIMSNYSIPFLGNSTASTIFAGIIGVLIIYGLFLLGIYIFKKYSITQTNNK
jgi:cobalt/nickel transport protein